MLESHHGSARRAGCRTPGAGVVSTLERPILQSDEILSAIRSAADPDCDVYEVHSSICDLVGVRWMAHKWAFLRCIKVLVREGNTLVFPSFTFSYARGGGFDVRRSRSETGILADWVRELDGAVRTPNPIFSFTAIGPRVQDFLDADHRDAYGAASVFAVLHRLDAGALMLGASWDYLSYLHHVEQMHQVPYREYKTFHEPANFGAGLVDPEMTVYVRRGDLRTELDFAAAGRAAEREGKVRRADLGASWVKFLKLSDVTAICSSEMARSPCFLLQEPQRVLRDIENLAAQASQPALRVALLGSQNTDTLDHYLKAALAEHAPSRRYETYVPPFGTMHQEVHVVDSPLRAFAPEATIIADTIDSICGVADAWSLGPDAIRDHVDRWVDTVRRWIEGCHGRVVLVDPVWTSSGVSGDHATLSACRVKALIKARLSPLYDALDAHGGVLIDTATLGSGCGEAIRDPRAWYLGRMPFSTGFTKVLANRIVGALLDFSGLGTRLIVVDLDNTLWGGVAGDDGFHGIALGGDYPGNAFQDFQRALASLAARGVALAISSKNDSATVLEIIDRHPGMVLRRNDFADFEVHWDPKAESIARIVSRLNLSAQNVMFLDDNPAERAAVRRALPQIVVPELGDDPALYVEVLGMLPQLNAASVTESDRARTDAFQRMAVVARTRAQTVDHDAFIRELAVTVTVVPLDETNTARAAQLMAKTNQFNSTVRRYGASELTALAAQGWTVSVIEVEDRFSPREIMGVLVLEGDGVLDSMVMSCRALGKGVEKAVLARLAAAASPRGGTLLAKFVETPRNGVFRKTLEELRFKRGDDGWSATGDTFDALVPDVAVIGLDAVAT